MKTLITISGFIAGFIVAVLLTSEFHCNSSNNSSSSTTSDTAIRITRTTDTFYRDTGSIKVIPYFVQLPTVIDTPASIIDYYTFKSVQDSFSGKNYKGFISDTLYMNSIFARQIRITTTQTDSLIHTTTTIRKSADGLYLGAETNLNYIGPDVMFIKGKWSYGGNVKFDPSTGFKAKEVNLRANYRLFGK